MCIAHNNCMSCPSIWAALSALLINILLGSFQLFLHSDQPLSEGGITPLSGVCQSGEAVFPTPEGASRRDGQIALICYATDDDQLQHHHAELYFQIWGFLLISRLTFAVARL